MPAETRWETLEPPEALSLPELPQWVGLEWQRTRPTGEAGYREPAHRPRHRAVLRVHPSNARMLVRSTAYLTMAGTLGALGLPWVAVAAGVGVVAVDLTTAIVRKRRARLVIDERGATVLSRGLRLGRADQVAALHELGRPAWIREEVDGEDCYTVLLDLGSGDPVRFVDAIADPREAQAIHETIVRLVDHLQRLAEG